MSVSIYIYIYIYIYPLKNSNEIISAMYIPLPIKIAFQGFSDGAHCHLIG